jgi:RND superfamily putative drug exporter
MGPLARWGGYAAQHWRGVILAWVVFVGVLGVVGVVERGRFADDLQLPGTESQAARDLLEERFPQQAGDPALLVMQAPAGFNDEAVRASVDDLLAQAAQLPDVAVVVSPYAPGGGAISRDGAIAYATLQYSRRGIELSDATLQALFDFVDDRSTPELQLEVGGAVVQSGEIVPPGRAELVGLAAGAVILLIAFGSAVAMGLPMVTALFSLATGLLLILLAASVLAMSSFTPAFAAMIGIGVGIDYALLVVTRYREELARGLSVIGAVSVAVDTAGRAVIFAGGAVVIALLALFVVGIEFVAAIGVAGAIVVLSAVLVATTLLPALLGGIGHHIDRWQIRAFHSVETHQNTGIWYRLSMTVQRHAWISAVGATVLLLVLAAPALDMRLGFSDAGNNPESMRSRRAYDLLSSGFGPGFNGPLIVAVELPEGATEAELNALSTALGAAEGVAFASPPTLSPAGGAAVISVIPVGAPQDESTASLLHRIRDEVIPLATAGTGLEAHVGGITAAFSDIGDRITARLPLFLAIVIGLSFVLLMAVFRSIVVPLKAALMNLLSIGAAYGVLVAIFQWGWLSGPLETGGAGPIESFLPMMLFAVLFGLSMDYEVFLLSRIRENYVGGMGNSQAVARGVTQTARVITAAAAIMVAVFLSFALSEGRIIKEFGVGLGVAIFLDATVVRLVLVPAVMELLGDANWWFPGWLDRLLPKVQIVGSTAGSMVVDPNADGD